MSTLPASSFGALLRRHRHSAGLTQEALAERASISADAISALERGISRAPRKDTIDLLADALKLSAPERAHFEAAGRHHPAASSSPDAPLSPVVLTFLFADLVGYTRFTLEHEDEVIARLIIRFAAAVRASAEAGGGRLAELFGDKALVVFGSARQALRMALDLRARCARETQADPALPLRVSIGLDAGEAILVEGNYLGNAVNLAARLCDLAGPGEILASEALIHLAHKMAGVFYSEREMTRLKGFTDPVAIIQVMPEAEQSAEIGMSQHQSGASEDVVET